MLKKRSAIPASKKFGVISSEFGVFKSRVPGSKTRIKNLLLFVFLVSTFSLFFLSKSISSQTDPASEWHLLYIKIRDRLISKEEAQERLKTLEAILREVYSKTGKSEKDDRLCFPLKGYSFHSIGGKGGSGYQAQGYDFFDGNDHRGHPGHDLFIRDKNQDGLDDMTGKPVEVLSVSPGMVVSVNFDWKPSSPLRGGNYLWICEPIKNRYYYYAHLDEIFVRVGQMVSKGDRLGIVGRTGVKAYLRHSPTHLHFVAHQSMDGYPKPINPYIELLRGNQE
jgi:murein DD-endopeptidase MepM/ murein hydrolase activator NlpD